MPTSFDTVIDRALITVNDYKLRKLYNQDLERFQAQMDAFLIDAIPNFFQCRQSLEYDLENREFKSDLTDTEISILGDFWILSWFGREVRNASQFNGKLQASGSFKSHSAAQALKEKSAYEDKIREKVYQKITDYQLEDLSGIDFVV